VAYDRTNPVVPDVVDQGAPAPAGPDQGGMPPDAQGMPPDQGMPMLAQMGAGGQGAPDPTTDGMSDVDLAALGAPVQGMQTPEEMQVAQMEQALTDPNTSPDQRAAIEAQLAIAARRRFAGLGGVGGLG
jgi:hypothetical protein